MFRLGRLKCRNSLQNSAYGISCFRLIMIKVISNIILYDFINSFQYHYWTKRSLFLCPVRRLYISHMVPSNCRSLRSHFSLKLQQLCPLPLYYNQYIFRNMSCCISKKGFLVCQCLKMFYTLNINQKRIYLGNLEQQSVVDSNESLFCNKASFSLRNSKWLIGLQYIQCSILSILIILNAGMVETTTNQVFSIAFEAKLFWPQKL